MGVFNERAVMGLTVDVDCLWLWLIKCLLWLDGMPAMVGWDGWYGWG